jgi:hypothetical protein
MGSQHTSLLLHMGSMMAVIWKDINSGFWILWWSASIFIASGA